MKRTATNSAIVEARGKKKAAMDAECTLKEQVRAHQADVRRETVLNNAVGKINESLCNLRTEYKHEFTFRFEGFHRKRRPYKNLDFPVDRSSELRAVLADEFDTGDMVIPSTGQVCGVWVHLKTA